VRLARRFSLHIWPASLFPPNYSLFQMTLFFSRGRFLSPLLFEGSPWDWPFGHASFFPKPVFRPSEPLFLRETVSVFKPFFSAAVCPSLPSPLYRPLTPRCRPLFPLFFVQFLNLFLPCELLDEDWLSSCDVCVSLSMPRLLLRFREGLSFELLIRFSPVPSNRIPLGGDFPILHAWPSSLLLSRNWSSFARVTAFDLQVRDCLSPLRRLWLGPIRQRVLAGLRAAGCRLTSQAHGLGS